jgi:transcription antitermination factor NusG
VGALEESRLRGQNYVFLEHVIKSLASEERDLFGVVLQRVGVVQSTFDKLVEERIDASSRHIGQETRLDKGVIEMLKRALGWAQWRERDRIGSTDILVALSQEKQGPFLEIFTALGVEPLTVIKVVRDTAAEYEQQSQQDKAAPSMDDDSAPYKKGEIVRIRSGAFSAMTAKVAGTDLERSIVKASVRIFGGSRIIELGFSDVEKIPFELD